ncbi:MAG: PAS domain-containing sensor histidine kinase, partial [Xanthomonadales bacterium]|nr:PAS domain-containing sensor histidine kinase [Xanthomonadales bacterium]
VGGERDERLESVEHLLDSLHPEDRTALVNSLTTQLRGPGELVEGSYRVRTSTGDWRWRLSRGRVVARDENGAPLRVVGTSSDITRIKDNELALARINAELESRVSQRTQALHDSNASLQNTIDKLQQTRQQLVDSEKMAALGGLVAGVAHEINTPIGVSVTAASFLQEQAEKLALPEDDAEAATTLEPLARFRDVAVNSSALILRNLRRADRLIKSFKQVAVDQSSEASRRINLRSYLEEVLTSLQPSLRKHKVELECPHDINFETYPGAIAQVISNLVMNSITHAFTPDKPGQIHVNAHAEGDSLRLIYRDDGIGMDEATRKRVFEPFFTTKRGTGGSGLGMHITWNLVTQALGGSIQCESAPGQGVCFSLVIPIARSAPTTIG